MKKKVIIIGLLAFLLYSGVGFFYNPTIEQSKINEVYAYSKAHNMNTNIAIFCDFNRHSGKKRFLVYDFNKKKVILSSLCAQGKGSGFSNKAGSYCSSLGFYEVSSYHVMRIGCGSFILKGKSQTNSNAINRGILIHPYFTVPDIPIYPIYTSRKASKGCFVISPIKFLIPKKLIRKNSNKPILLYAYNH